MSETICIDSNALTYLVQAMTNGTRPVGNTSDEQIALLRIYLYRDDILYISPTVCAEYQQIRDKKKKMNHQEATDILLGELLQTDLKEIEFRVSEYMQSHSGSKDCRILAESELGGGDVLLTYDHSFQKRMKGNTHHIYLKFPSTYWLGLGIPKGSRPAKSPHPNNPLSKEEWWVWK